MRVLQAGRREVEGQYLRLMVMEYVEGQDALETLHAARDRRMEPQRCAEIALACAKALKYAHGQGIVHRDVKPANVLISKSGESIKLLDFGLARLAVKGENVSGGGSTTGSILGTPQYMPPEQCEGKLADGRADIYSLGVTLYELLTGSLPFTGDTVFSIIEGHVRKPLELPAAAFKDVPTVFHELIAGMCEKKPDDRLPLKNAIEKLEAFIHGSRPSLLTSRTSMVEEESAKARTNLIKRSTSFVGRGTEIGAIAELLGQEHTRLVTVVGPGGVGKTRITQEFGLKASEGARTRAPSRTGPATTGRAERTGPATAGRVERTGPATRADEDVGVPPFPGGVWFCDLTESRTVDGIAAAVAFGLGIPLTQVDGVGQLAASLSMREPLLLILDNFEQVVQHADATVGVWMAKAPKVKFLASSREPLHLEGEKSFPLHPLTYDGIQLFIDRASDVKRGFTVDDPTRAAIAKIVDHLDGIPLAIELAASRCAALSPEKILERLSRRFDLLKGRRQDASARQATLRGAIDWSWDLLKPYERAALAQCSVFQGGFFLEAAEAVVDLGAYHDAPFAMDVIESLVEKSLLVAFEVPALKGEMRYRMLESIRQYGQERVLGYDGLLEPLLLHHAEHFLQYAEHWNEETYGPNAVEALNRIELEYDNLFGIQDVFEQTQPGLAARAIYYAARTLKTRGPWNERIPRLERALKRLGESTELALRIRLSHAMTFACSECGSIDGLKAAADLSRELGSRLTGLRDSESMELACLTALAQVLFHFRAGETRQAGETLRLHMLAMGLVYGGLVEQCVHLSKKLKREVAANVLNMGNVHNDLGEYRQALERYTEAEVINRELGNIASVATSVGNRGLNHSNCGEFRQALDCYAEAEAINRQLGNRAGVSVNVGAQGEVHLAMGNLDEAWADFEKAETICREILARGVLSYWTLGKARVLLARAVESDRDSKHAMLIASLPLAREALELRESLGMTRTEGFLDALSVVAVIEKRWEETAAGRDGSLSPKSPADLVRTALDPKARAMQAKALAEDLKIDRLEKHGPNAGEVTEYWRYVDEVLAWDGGGE